MKIQLKSDLHMEFSYPYTRPHIEKDEYYINPDADILVLAGDITGKRSVDYFKKTFEDVKIPILYIPGNHEYYGRDWNTADAEIEADLKDSNITLINESSFSYTLHKEKVIFIGATLWTAIYDPFAMVGFSRWSDKRHIENISIDEWNYKNAKHRHHLVGALVNTYDSPEPKQKMVVVTHHLPSEQSSPKQFIGTTSQAYFVNTLENVMLEEYAPDLWLHGHTHDSCDYNIGKTRVVCNPYGYFPNMLNKEYHNDLIIEI